MNSIGPAPKRPSRDTGRRLHGALSQKIGKAIISGVYASGDRLLSETLSSQHFEVSRTAYREALQVLSAKGLVESRPRAGTRVLPRQRWNLLDAEVLTWAFQDEPDLPMLGSLVELRAIILPGAARLAAERRACDELRSMDRALSAMRTSVTDGVTGKAAVQAFHVAVLAATRNDMLITLSGSFTAAYKLTEEFEQKWCSVDEETVLGHNRLYQAILAGDGRLATEIMSSLLA